MQNQKKFYFLILPLVFFLLAFFGCATVPTAKREALPTYNINGTTYFPLISFSDLRNIDCQYDTFTRTVTLSKGLHRINLRVGDNLALVDGMPKHLSAPIDIYQGAVVAPYKFKEQILDALFKESAPLPKPTLSALKIRKIVIDPGHGGFDPGAIGKTGLREKDINLDIAKRVGNLLRAEGVEVIMTRSSDRFVPLSKRVEIANRANAELFVAIHANANRVKGLNGFEVYYVSPNVNDAKRAYASAMRSDLNFERACFASDSLDLKATLWDMIYTCSRAESIDLSRNICRSMESGLGVKVLGIKGARFEVLRGVHMPAVLIEVGFVSNGNEERMLKNSYYRQKLAEGIVEGIKDYAQNAAL